MLPIIAIANVANGALAILLSIRLYQRSRSLSVSGRSSIGARYFLAMFSLVAVICFLFAVPGLLSQNPLIIMVTFALSDLAVIAAAIVTTNISFYAMKRPIIGTIVSLCMVTTGVVYFFGFVLSLTPAVEFVVPPYTYWFPGTPYWLRLLSGGVAGVSTALFIATFLVLGLRSSVADIRQRSFLLASGMSVLAVGSSLFFFFSTGGFAITFLAAVCGFFGIALLLKGVPYRDEDADDEPTQTGETNVL